MIGSMGCNILNTARWGQCRIRSIALFSLLDKQKHAIIRIRAGHMDGNDFGRHPVIVNNIPTFNGSIHTVVARLAQTPTEMHIYDPTYNLMDVYCFDEKIPLKGLDFNTYCHELMKLYKDISDGHPRCINISVRTTQNPHLGLNIDWTYNVLINN